MKQLSGTDPLTRTDLLDLMQGYKKTAALRTAIHLGLFDALADGPASADALAERLGAQPRGVRLLLNALTAIGLLDGDGRDHRLAAGSRELLVSSEPTYCGGNVYVAASDREWQALGDLDRTVRDGGPVPGVDAEAPDFDYWVDFARHTTLATQGGARLVADALVDWARTRPAPAVLDVGAGAGSFGFTLAQRLPSATVCALDWPDVLERAAEHAERMGVRERTTFRAGDAFDIPLGGPYDIVVVANLLVHFSPERCRELLGRLRDVLTPDGRLVVAGFTAESPGTDLHAHLLNLLMLSWTTGGEAQPIATYAGLLTELGLPEPQILARPGVPIRALITPPVPGG